MGCEGQRGSTYILLRTQAVPALEMSRLKGEFLMIGFGCLHRAPGLWLHSEAAPCASTTPRIILTSVFHPFTALSLAQACPQPCMCRALRKPWFRPGPLSASFSVSKGSASCWASSFLSSSSWATCSITPCPLAAFFASSAGNLDLGCWDYLKPLPFLGPASFSMPLPAPNALLPSGL